MRTRSTVQLFDLLAAAIAKLGAGCGAAGFALFESAIARHLFMLGTGDLDTTHK